MNLTESEHAPNVPLILAVVFVVIMVGAIIDLTLDAPSSWFSAHVLFEGALILISLGAALYLGTGWYRTQRSVDQLERMLEERRQQRDAWQANAERLLTGLARAIDDQFGDWGLTEAERETALMVLKGYSHKKIARLTSRSERTVRQHAVAVYRKSGLSGRAELSAFFLEGLPVPASVRATAAPDRETETDSPASA